LSADSNNSPETSTQRQSASSPASEHEIWIIRNLQLIAANFDYAMEDKIVRMRARALMDIPQAKLSKAFFIAVQSCKRNPTVAELRELAEDGDPRHKTLEFNHQTACDACDDTGFVRTADIGGNLTMKKCVCHGDPTAHLKRKQIKSFSSPNDPIYMGDVWKLWNEICLQKGVDASKKMPERAVCGKDLQGGAS
jgi:hypothetical protein